MLHQFYTIANLGLLYFQLFWFWSLLASWLESEHKIYASQGPNVLML